MEAEDGETWEACPLSCVACRGRCWLASGPCSWVGQLLSWWWGAYQALWVFGSRMELLAPSPLTHPQCPRLPGGWYRVGRQ